MWERIRYCLGLRICNKVINHYNNLLNMDSACHLQELKLSRKHNNHFSQLLKKNKLKNIL